MQQDTVHRLCLATFLLGLSVACIAMDVYVIALVIFHRCLLTICTLRFPTTPRLRLGTSKSALGRIKQFFEIGEFTTPAGKRVATTLFACCYTVIVVLVATKVLKSVLYGGLVAAVGLIVIAIFVYILNKDRKAKL